MFIGHSWGGITIKMALFQASWNASSGIFDATKSIIFFRMPYTGREHEVIERLLALQRTFDAAGAKQNEAREASRNIHNLASDASIFLSNLSRKLQVTSFYEREIYNDVLAMDENQTRGNYANETTIGLDANRYTVGKFASENDKGFAEVHRAMHMHLIEISKALDAEGHPPTENKPATLDDLEATTKPL
ncbi:hypothetical protein AA0112_g10694 [Alternaria arborescens]|nr:hypothetical protein AA0112_g10694 [Alternaria arborescens]